MLLRKNIVFVSLFVAFNSSVFAQFSIIQKSTFIPVQADSVDIQYYKSKKPWNVTAQIAGLNLGVWAFGRYALKADYSYISMQSVKDNFSHGFVWDNDQLSTNLFWHPYQGSLYYISARSNGYGYLASSLFSVAGSFSWEMFLENEYPSTNDILATPIGGTILGEVFYRTSDRILNDKTTGGERFARELAVFFIAPTRSLSRIISGDAWRVRQTSGRQFGVPNINSEFSIGVRALELRDKILDKSSGLASKVSVEYGERFETDGMKPYDYSTFSGSFYIQKGQPLLGRINVLGRIVATDLMDTKKDYLNIGLYQHFNYYDSDTISKISGHVPYKLGTPASFGVGLMHKSKRYDNWHFNSYFHLNAILLGASLNDYSTEERNYHLSAGFSIFSGLFIAYKDRIGLSWGYKSFFLFPWGYPEDYDLGKIGKEESDFQADKATTIVNTSTIKLDVRLRNQLYLTSEHSFYRRFSHYDYFEDVNSWSLESQLMLSYKF
jgi:hypothetical protein